MNHQPMFALLLGDIQRRIGKLHDVFDVMAVLWPPCGSQAAADGHRWMLGQRGGLGNGGKQPLAYRLGQRR